MLLRRLFPNRFVRILLWIFITAVTLCILLFVWTNWSGRRRWAATKAVLEHEGETLDFSKLLPATPPAAKNLLAIEPLNDLAAVVDNDDKKGVQGVRRQALEAMKWSGGTHPASNGVLLGKAEDIQAWAKYLREIKYLELPAEVSVSAREVLTALDVKLPLLKQIADEAVNRPLAMFTPGLREREMPDLLVTLRVPHYNAVQTLAKALALRARAAVAAGDSSEASHSIIAIHRLAMACEQEPLLIGFLVGNSLEMLALEPLWLGLREHAFAEGDLRQLQDLFAVDHTSRALLLAMRGELAAGMNAVEFLQLAASGQRVVDGDLVKALTADGIKVSHYLRRAVPGGLFDHWKAVIAELELQYLIQPLKTSGLRESVRKGESVATELQRNANPLLHPDHLFARLMLPAVAQISMQALVLETRRRQALIALALERFFVKQGRYPATLAELTPDFLPAVPLDPCGEKAMRYRITPAGLYQLWSVGFDAKDDGGKVIVDAKKPSKMSKPEYVGDWTWQYEAVEPAK